ncbi:HK97-gp10 family putative phage morphogenesis protein [Bacillus sp. FSL W7-1360]
MSVEVRGGDKIDRHLRQLAAREKRVRNKALRAAAVAVADRLEKNTPEDKKSRGKHLKDDVKISGVKQDGSVVIGYGKDTYWRAHFVEMGTIKMNPQHFILQTEREMSTQVIHIMETEIKRGLGL